MIIGVVVFAGLLSVPGEAELTAKLPETFARAAAHYKALDAAAVPLQRGEMPQYKGRPNCDLRVPHGLDRETGKPDMRSVYWWSSGHFPGSLWYLYEATGEAYFRDRALAWTETLEPNKTIDDNHDIGFIIQCSYGNAKRILKTDRYDGILTEAAKSLASRYCESLGLIRSWGKRDECNDFLVIPDNLMNLELLESVSVMRHDETLDKIAMSHADVTMRHHFKADGGCYHVLDYDQRTGRVKGVMRGQGASIETTWSRGQSWCIYGYTMMYRMTGYRRYLDQAVRCADFAMKHPNMPEDGIPYWDYGAPGEERDSSAAAIMASALLELCTFLPPEQGVPYYAFALRQLCALTGPGYFAEAGENGNWILKHGVGFKPEGREVDVPLDYGDYYFLEALLRFRNIREERTRLAALSEKLTKRDFPADEMLTRFYHKAGASASLGAPNVQDAEHVLNEEIPALPDELYLDYLHTGNRARYQKPWFRRIYMLDTLVGAEAQQKSGRYLDKIQRLLVAILDMKSWILPAHEWRDGQLSNFKGTYYYTDLFGSELAAHLGMTVVLLGDRLPPELVSRIEQEVERRVFTPLRRDIRWPSPDCAEDFDIRTRKMNWWLNGRENWNAVCSDNMLTAALSLLKDPIDRSLFVDAAIRSVDSYLESFEEDGYCSEGMGYWNYGFGHHLRMGLLLRKVSEGKIDIFTRPLQRKAASYARAFTIADGVPSLFADGGGKADACNLQLVDEIWPDLPKGLATTSEFPMAQVWVLRDAGGFSVAFKGGHNNELHNHNDVGSYSVAIGGRYASGDPGQEVYTRDTFSSRRYQSKINNSFGHPLPVVGGSLQQEGKSFAARIVSKETSESRTLVALDLTKAYRVATLRSLVRTFVYDRAKREFSVTDHVEFDQPTTFESAFTTFLPEPNKEVVFPMAWNVRPEVRVEGGSYSVVEEDIANPGRNLSPRRVGIRLDKPVEKATIAFVFHDGR